MEDEIQRAKLRIGKHFSTNENFRMRYDTTKEVSMHFERVTITPENHVRSRVDGEMRGRKVVLERMNEQRRVRKEQ